jgi:serine/threonine-protein kinase
VTEVDLGSAHGVREGEILAGKYQVERVLGAGGMGVVVAARHVGLDEKVAIKFLLPEMLRDPEVVARFAGEARAAVKIKSEHVARVHDVGTLENGAPYMVMEYLEGGDLAAWLEQRGALPIEQAVEFVLQACVAVAEAHALGIVHRDLKPANLFCVRRADGQLSIKVLDFGISKLTGPRGSLPRAVSMTATSAVMGSPLYMSPEQMLSAKSASAQSDIWALGVILYELLTGKVPFDGEAITEVAVNVATLPPHPTSRYRPDVAPELEAVILRCLEKDRRDRYPNVAEFALGLAPFATRSARASIERITNTIQAAGLSRSALSLPSTPRSEGTKESATEATALPVSDTRPGRTNVRPKSLAIVAIAVIPALVVFIGVGVVWKMAFTNNPATSLPSAELVTAAPAPTPSVPPSTTSSPPTASAPPAASSAVSQATPAPRSAAAVSPRSSRTPPAAKPAAAKGPAASCDPPYTLDSQGEKQFKPECYLNH